MLSTNEGSQGTIRREADQIEAALGRGRFRRRRKLEHSPRRRAARARRRRARQGRRRRRAAVPVPPLRRQRLRLRLLDRPRRVRGRGRHAADLRQADDRARSATSRVSVPFSAWILRVAHNAAIDHVRMRRPVPLEEVHPPDAADDGAGGRERFADLRLALAALPAEQRDVIVLRFLVGLTPARGRRADRPLRGRRARAPAPRPAAAALRDARARAPSRACRGRRAA